MKISIITILDNINYGTYLQAFALAEYLQLNKHHIELIYYERKNQETLFNVKRILKTNHYSLLKKLIKMFAYICIIPLIRYRFRNTLRKYFVVTKKYSLAKLYSIKSESDIYITGGDQVWNSEYNKGIDPAFYLDFVSNKKIISFASSIGTTSIDNIYKQSLYTMLSKYSFISVRENNALKLLNDLGLTNVYHVLDPIFLFNKNEWLQLFNIHISNTIKPYLLVYSVEGNKTDSTLTLATKIAKKRNLKIYFIEFSFFQLKRLFCVDRYFYNISLKKYISLFANASFIIASSFHGTAFSINFSKQFITLLPNQYNIRVNDLLNTFQLQNNGLHEYDVSSYDPNHYSEVNYEKISKDVNRKRLISQSMLNRFIQ